HMSDSPTFMHTFGPAADPITRLGWILSAVSMLVVVVIGVLILASLFRRREIAGNLNELDTSPGRSDFIYIGTAASIVILVGSFVYVMAVLGETSSPQFDPAITVQVIGHQWWWELRYSDRNGANAFVTANEIHVPVGHPVRFILSTADVIHSFWVPQLAGKTDLIPGRRNATWFQANTPGKYLGLCAEYCGLQHARMHVQVVAEDAPAFRAWWGKQMAARAPPATPDIASGENVFLSRCSACHTIRGTLAAGKIGPDLTHVMSRATIAAGTIPNTRGFLAGWILNPGQIKPGTQMPAVPLTPAELESLLGYLETLK
ncbi:MAG: cytochrome c oxidase subunit II, partial [Gemmatimonadales bacterium]